MAKAFELITTVTVGSGGASSIDFTSIPSTYTDLYVEYSLRVTLSGGPYYFSDCGLRFNGDTGANYNNLNLRAREGSVGSGGSTTSTLISLYEASAGNATANSFGNGSFYITGYSSSNYKPVSLDGGSETNNATQVQLGFVSGLWKSTSAITSIKLYDQNATNFVQYSSASLYGIKNS